MWPISKSWKYVISVLTRVSQYSSNAMRCNVMHWFQLLAQDLCTDSLCLKLLLTITVSATEVFFFEVSKLLNTIAFKSIVCRNHEECNVCTNHCLNQTKIKKSYKTQTFNWKCLIQRESDEHPISLGFIYALVIF